MRALLILAIIALMALVMTASAQNQIPINAKNFRVTAYKNYAQGVYSVSNYARVIPPAVMYIPNAFTPNGDGINETFAPKGQSITTFNMKIFNRWGQLLYETNDMENGWNGNYNGTKSQEDVYIYKIKARGEIAGVIEETGTVTLID